MKTLLDRTKRGRWLFRGTIESGQPGSARVVLVDPDGQEGEIAPRRRLWATLHSPTGYGWGYQGSGAAQLAQDMIREGCGIEPAPALYQRFKQEVVATFPQDDGWELALGYVQTWVNHRVSHDPLVAEGFDLWADREETAVALAEELARGEGAGEHFRQLMTDLAATMPPDRLGALSVRLVRAAATATTPEPLH